MSITQTVSFYNFTNFKEIKEIYQKTEIRFTPPVNTSLYSQSFKMNQQTLINNRYRVAFK